MSWASSNCGPAWTADPKSPHAANYDESKANVYPNLPDPLVMNNGKPVTTAAMWWSERRPEIVEMFDREILGRSPAGTPKVTWEVKSTVEEKNGDMPVVTKTLVGHVDNSADPSITVNIDLTLDHSRQCQGPGARDHGIRAEQRIPRHAGQALSAVCPAGAAAPHLAGAGAWPGAGATPNTFRTACRTTTVPDSPRASSASSTRASRANSTTGAR